jgi:hypothetical protein
MVRSSYRLNLLRRFRSGGLPARIGALLGIVALLLQGALATAHGPAMTPSRMADDGSPLMLGPSWLAAFCGSTAHASGDSGAPAGSGRALPTCPLCQALQHVGPWFPPVAGWAPIAPMDTAVAMITASDRPPIPPTLGFTQARAPPAFF